MSVKRIGADLGFLSLELAEATDKGMPWLPDHRAGEGGMLRALLAGRGRTSFGDGSTTQEAGNAHTRSNEPFDWQRLQSLAELLQFVSRSHLALRDTSVSLRLPADLLKDAIVNVRKIGPALEIELTIGDADACSWLGTRLGELVDMLAARVSCSVVIRIMDEAAAHVVAEAARESDDHSWSSASFYDN